MRTSGAAAGTIFLPVTKKSSSRMRRFAGSRRTTRTKPSPTSTGTAEWRIANFAGSAAIDGRGNGTERAPRDVLATVLLGEGLADVVLGDRSALEQERPDAAARETLDRERAMDALFGDGTGPNE